MKPSIVPADGGGFLAFNDQRQVVVWGKTRREADRAYRTAIALMANAEIDRRLVEEWDSTLPSIADTEGESGALR